MKSLYTQYALCIQNNDKFIPPSVEIDLTNACNQACVYCNSADYRKQNPGTGVTVQDFIELLDKLSEWRIDESPSKVQTVTFVGGGEPTMFPGYEHVVQYAVEKGFMVAIITNGTYLHKLLDLPDEILLRISWIGVDVDSGIPTLFDSVRQPKKHDQFNLVKSNITSLQQRGVNIDLKALMLDQTSTRENIISLFELADDLNVRMLYFRLANINHQAYDLPKHIQNFIHETAKVYRTPMRLNVSRSDTRYYTECHAMYLLPVFSADRKIHLCCERRGDEAVQLVDWVEDDFRDYWMDSNHHKKVKNIDVSKCDSCRPNTHNNAIQRILDDPSNLEDLFF